ncbi:MAG: PQQ-dependent sugar dehydrogenase [Ginsengibacter sp.]
MKRINYYFPMAILFLLVLNSCNSGSSADNSSITSDSITIAKGEAVFVKNCSGCHTFRQDGIGPQLGGITAVVSADWIRHFIKNPKKMMESGDARTTELKKKYQTATMPSFETLTDDELNGIIAYLNMQTKKEIQSSKSYGNPVTNPVPDTIALSNLVVGLKLVTQIPASSVNGKTPLARITKLDFEPHTSNIFILDIRGKLYEMQNDKPQVYMDMAKLESKFINQPGLGTGFGSFAFHPDFLKNGLLYTTHTESPGSGKADFSYADSIKVTLQWVLTEWKTDNPRSKIFSGKSRELLRVNMVTGMHGIQEITFNPLAKPGDKDYGMLYIGIGDGGSVDEGYSFIAHNKDKVWGTILRINPSGNNSTNGQYGIPADNPFVNSHDHKALGEIYAYGFRNPHRITWSKSGQMLVSNIGGVNIEALDLVKPGYDYGWPIREGTFVLNPYGDISKVYPLPANDSIYHITYPVAQFGHHEGWTAISGGYEYWGTTLPQLKGKFLFGDISSGKLYYVNMADIKQGQEATIKKWQVSINGTIKTLQQLCGYDGKVEIRFGRDDKGELYILTKTDGKVYKLVNAKVKL